MGIVGEFGLEGRGGGATVGVPGLGGWWRIGEVGPVGLTVGVPGLGGWWRVGEVEWGGLRRVLTEIKVTVDIQHITLWA